MWYEGHFILSKAGILIFSLQMPEAPSIWFDSQTNPDSVVKVKKKLFGKEWDPENWNKDMWTDTNETGHLKPLNASWTVV